MLTKIVLQIALFVVGLVMAVPTKADVVISVFETGGNVVVNYSGTLDLPGLNFTTGNGTEDFSGYQDHATTGSAFINAFATTGGGSFYSNPFSSVPAAGWKTTGVDLANSSGGNQLVVFTGGTFSDPLRLHTADVIGTTWSGSGFMQFDSTTMAGLGLDLSMDRVWTLNNLAANTITLTAVPEPGSIGILGMLVVGLIAVRRRMVW